MAKAHPTGNQQGATMTAQIQFSAPPLVMQNDGDERSTYTSHQITQVSMLPDYIDILNIADDLTSLYSQFGSLNSQRLPAKERLNSAVELDIDGSASDLAPSIQPTMSPQQLLQLLRQRFDDISDMWLILQSMIANSYRWKLERQLLEQTQDLLEAEASDVERQALWAGVNVHGLIQQYAGLTRVNARQLRLWYRVWLSWEQEEETGFLWAMMDEVDFSALSTIFHYLSRATRYDMNALRPSTQPDHLSTLLNKISAITRFFTLVEGIFALCPVVNVPSVQKKTLSAHIAQFLKAVLSSPVVFLPQWETLRAQIEPCDFLALRLFLRELRSVVQALPDLFFKEESDRHRLDAKVLQILTELEQGQSGGAYGMEC
jgi:type III secretion system YopN/LcrE/InvE/MxiC family regulator